MAGQHGVKRNRRSCNAKARRRGVLGWSTSAAALLAIGMGSLGAAAAPAARADDSSPADALTGLTPAELLADAQTEVAGASNVLNQIGGGPIGEQLQGLDTISSGLSNLGSEESDILSYDNGAFSDLLTPLFTNLDQGWYQATEALINADAAFDTAVLSGSGVDAADLSLTGADLQLFGELFLTDVVVDPLSLFLGT